MPGCDDNGRHVRDIEAEQKGRFSKEDVGKGMIRLKKNAKHIPGQS